MPLVLGIFIYCDTKNLKKTSFYSGSFDKRTCFRITIWLMQQILLYMSSVYTLWGCEPLKATKYVNFALKLRVDLHAHQYGIYEYLAKNASRFG